MRKLMTKFKQVLIRIISPFYSTLSRVMPNRYYPYKFNDIRIYLNVKESPMMMARALGVYEVDKMTAVKTLLREGGTFLDVGANKGDFSLLASKIVREHGRVLAFEPESTNCQWIQKSIQLNGYTNIELHEIALSDVNGETRLYLSKKSGWHTLLPNKENRDEGAIKVTSRTLDSFLEETGYRGSIEMMKIDVEGAEMQVLRGASETLTMNRNIILLIDIHSQLGVNPKDICSYLEKMNFTLFRMKPSFDHKIVDITNLTEVLARRR